MKARIKAVISRVELQNNECFIRMTLYVTMFISEGKNNCIYAYGQGRKRIKIGKRIKRNKFAECSSVHARP